MKKKKKVKKQSHHVFAYGSNMNQQQMGFRCPTAKLVCVAQLDGHRLMFAGESARWDGGVATIVPDRRSIVVGVVWKLSGEDLERLDSFEGYPYVYDRAPVSVRATRTKQFWCHTYVKNASERPTLPSEEYLRTILDGYKMAGAPVPSRLSKLYAQLRGGYALSA